MVKRTKSLCVAMLALLCSTLSFADPDVIIIGAGPVGLSTAVQLALYTNGQIKIRIYEAHETYKRTHSLSLKEEAFVNAHPDERYAHTWQHWKSPVPITTVERDLLTLATDLGIEIIRPYKVESLEQLRADNLETKVIIGADGSHSMVRRHFVSEAQTQRQDLQHTVRVTYTTNAATRPLKMWTEAPLLLSRVNHVVTESLRKLSEDEYQVTLDIIVPKEEYEAIHPFATFAKPILFEVDAERARVPKKLEDTIAKWMKERVEIVKESVKKDSVKVTSTELVTYISPQVVFLEDGVEHFLVGDAAFGVPWWRSGNNGFRCVNILVKVIARKFVQKLNRKHLFAGVANIGSPVGALNYVMQGAARAHENQDYQDFVQTLQTREVLFANLKRIGIFALEMPIRTVQTLSRGTVSPRIDPVKVWEDALLAEMVIEAEPAGLIAIEYDPNLDALPLVDTDEEEAAAYSGDAEDVAARASVGGGASVGN